MVTENRWLSALSGNSHIAHGRQCRPQTRCAGTSHSVTGQLRGTPGTLPDSDPELELSRFGSIPAKALACDYHPLQALFSLLGWAWDF